MPVRRWIVSQVGSRRRYAVPRSCWVNNALELFITDVWFPHFRQLIRRFPGTLGRLSGRWCADLPKDRVLSFTRQALAAELIRSVKKAPATVEGIHEQYMKIGKSHAKRVARSCSRLTLDPTIHRFYTFSTCGLEAIKALREKGVLCVVDQVDAARVHFDIVGEECDRRPGWQAAPGRPPDRFFERLAEEWASASLVVVSSNWTRQALVQQGVKSEKIAVVPLVYERTGLQERRPEPNRKGPLRVLFLGQISLAKGIAYLFEAARALPDVQFELVGSALITDAAMEAASKNVSFLGHVPSSTVRQYYHAADVFVLPTLSDGFALTQLEAMAHGVPVIATPNCGEVVTDGVDGFVIPARNSQALAGAICRLNDDRDLLEMMSEKALLKSKAFPLQRFCSDLDLAVDTHCQLEN